MSEVKSRRVSRPFLIGLFVIFGSLLSIAVIFWLSAEQFLKERILYVSYFEGSVEGLEPGSAVKYQGVPVGTVYNIGVAPDGKLIELIMNINKKIEITDSLRAKAELAGIAGSKFIQLFYPTDPKIAKMFPHINFKPPYTLIKSSPSGLEEIEIAMREVINNLKLLEVSKISAKTINFLDATTQFFKNEELYQTIENLESASSKLASIAAKADTSKILDYIANSSGRLYQTSVELQVFANKLNDQIDNLNLDKYVENAFAGYDSTVQDTRRAINSLGYRIDATLINLNEIIDMFKTTNSQLYKSLRTFEDDPSAILLSEPPKKKD